MQLHVELWDKDVRSSDDFVSELHFNLTSSDTLISSSTNLPPSLPPPVWLPLTRYDTRTTNSRTFCFDPRA
ncbi:hypothetical protein EON66_10560 [archaeon]|nr:MAG: hypothetical protein EON66_10560 [archaeon]